MDVFDTSVTTAYDFFVRERQGTGNEALAFANAICNAPPPTPALVTTPIPMRLPCELCGELHIDEGEYATLTHHTHACQVCGAVWRPAVVPTVGVRFLPGFKNNAD